MKRVCLLCLCVLCSYILCACSVANSSSDSEKTATNQNSSSELIATNSSSKAVCESEPSISQTTEIDESKLQFYQVLSDIPYAKIRFGEITGVKQDTHEAIFSEKGADGTATDILFKNGEHWMDAPPNQIFGDFAFSDAQFLYIPAYFPTGAYRWMAIQYNIQPSDSLHCYFFPSETDDKIFVRAEDDMLLLENGDGFNVKTLEWFENGVVVEDAKIY